FSLGRAHALFTELFSPIEEIVRKKKYVMVVPTEALTSLPFHLLITDPPKVAEPGADQISVYRDASWIAKRHALSVLPSVISLKTLRGFGKSSGATKPLLGYGDPVFHLSSTAKSGKQVQVRGQSNRTRSFASYYQGDRPDLTLLSTGLSPLPET